MSGRYECCTKTTQIKVDSSKAMSYTSGMIPHRDNPRKELAMYQSKAKRILAMCGIRMAALYLRNRGYTAEQAVTILLK